MMHVDASVELIQREKKAEAKMMSGPPWVHLVLSGLVVLVVVAAVVAVFRGKAKPPK
jgi:hypothetical protein